METIIFICNCVQTINICYSMQFCYDDSPHPVIVHVGVCVCLFKLKYVENADNIIKIICI